MSDTSVITASDLLGMMREPAGGPPVILDIRWTLAGSDLDGYLYRHLPGAVFVDLDRDLAAAPGEGGRHPLPDPADLQATWRAAGIDNDSRIVVYDGGIGMAAARAWWLLRWSGIGDVRVLDGGLPAWIAEPDRPTASGPSRPVIPGSMTVVPGGMPVVDIDEAAAVAASAAGRLVDARVAARFRGEVEPIDPVAGHIPGSVNLPVADLLTGDGSYRHPEAIAAAFAAVGVTGSTERPAASCGSGVTACQLVLAGEIVGLDLALFPGSYSQWCAQGRPVAAGG